MKKLTFNEEPQEKVLDRNGKEIEIGSHVIWYDPEIEARDLSVIWTVDDIRGDLNEDDTIILITSEYGSEAEAYYNEIKKVKPKKK